MNRHQSQTSGAIFSYPLLSDVAQAEHQSDSADQGGGQLQLGAGLVEQLPYHVERVEQLVHADLVHQRYEYYNEQKEILHNRSFYTHFIEK